jgi:hypothetical protein
LTPTHPLDGGASKYVVRAYDANRTLIAADNDPKHLMAPCYITPDKVMLRGLARDPDPAMCTPATHWP